MPLPAAQVLLALPGRRLLLQNLEDAAEFPLLPEVRDRVHLRDVQGVAVVLLLLADPLLLLDGPAFIVTGLLGLAVGPVPLHPVVPGPGIGLDGEVAGNRHADNEGGDHQRRRQHRPLVPPRELAEAIPQRRRTRLHRLVVQVALEVPGRPAAES
jgi:hypothetical protein